MFLRQTQRKLPTFDSSSVLIFVFIDFIFLKCCGISSDQIFIFLPDLETFLLLLAPPSFKCRKLHQETFLTLVTVSIPFTKFSVLGIEAKVLGKQCILICKILRPGRIWICTRVMFSFFCKISMGSAVLRSRPEPVLFGRKRLRLHHR